MDIKESTQELRRLAIDKNLPKTDMALFGVKCLYCGKSDRIRRLETPDELQGEMDQQDYETYAGLWERLAGSSESLGVCKFCQNILRIYAEEGKTEALYE